jgi:Domain of unknown function (DUF4159)
MAFGHRAIDSTPPARRASSNNVMLSGAKCSRRARRPRGSFFSPDTPPAQRLLSASFTPSPSSPKFIIFATMKGLFKALLFLSLGWGAAFGQKAAPANFKLKIAKLQYDGGGDWYANPSSVPNLIEFIGQNTTIPLDQEEYVVKPGGTQLFQYPFVYMTGHGRFLLSPEDASNMRTYLMSGGFLHIDDNYGMDKFVRLEMKKVFPELDFVELPFDHPIYHQQYEFPKGLPKIHEHDGKPAQGFGLVWEGRMVCFYTFECDLGDGWEDPQVHNDAAEIRQQALKMGLNIFIYALTN